MALKSYTVYFFTKENRTEYLNEVFIEANTAKEACAICKQWYHEKTGKNAFRPTTKKEDWTWYVSRGNVRQLFK